MANKRHKPEEIVQKLRQVDVLVGQGMQRVDAIREVRVTEQTYYRWRREYGGLRTDQAKKFKELERENARLKRLLADEILGKELLKEALEKRRALKKDAPVRRVTFNAITKAAVTEAMERPREVDMELVEAYLARRALDYLVGFNLSPVLWRKLPGAKSAGRVQSVCLRLIVEREMEIEAFRPREYWSVKAMLATPRGQEYEARLTVLAGKKLDRFDIANQTQAMTFRKTARPDSEAMADTENAATMRIAPVIHHDR